MRSLLFQIALILLLTTACMRVNTNPLHEFEEVKAAIACRSGEMICWDTDPVNADPKGWIDSWLSEDLSVERAVAIALANNKHLQGVFEELGIAKTAQAQAGLLPNPLFSLAYRFSTQSAVSDLIDFTFLQNFLELILLPLKKKAATAELDATVAEVTGEVLQLIAQTKIAFYHFQSLSQQWNWAEQILLVNEASYEVARELFLTGNMTEVEVAIKQREYEESKIMLSKLEVDLLTYREKLNQLMGLWGPQIRWQAAGQLPDLPTLLPDWSDIESCAIENSVQLRQMHAELKAIAASMGVETSRLVFPGLDLGVSGEREDGVWFIGPAIATAIPLFDFGQANSAKAQALLWQQWDRFTAAAIDLRSLVRLTKVQLETAKRQYAYYKRVVVPLGEWITQLTLEQHNAMQKGVFSLLDARRTEIEMNIEMVTFLRDYWVFRTQVEILMKGGMVL